MTAITAVYVDPTMEASTVVQQIRQGLKDIPWHVCADLDRVIRELISYHADPGSVGKKVLLIRPFAGRLVKNCPGTGGHICCGYKTINVLTNCTMDCSYCILQGYLNNPCVTLYPDFAKVFDEIEEILTKYPRRVFRFGTGELGDSLVLDKIIGFAAEAVPFFADKENAILELKTKSAEVDHLLGMDHRGKTVISWSLNPQQVIEQEEHGAASLDARLEAARCCAEAGYRLGFHFDPLIYYPGWEEDYHGVVDFLLEKIDPAQVLWVSLGGLRFPPALKQMAQKRFPCSRIFTGELITGEDGKLRYIKPLRVKLYRRMIEWLKVYDEQLFIYLCMERGDVWQEVFGNTPASTEGLNKRFEQRVRHFLEEMP